MKKIAALFLALALSLSLCVPALADGHDLYIYYANGESDAVLGSKSGNGWSFAGDDNTCTLTLSGLKDAHVLISHLGTDPTVVLAAGTQTKLTAFETDTLSDAEKFPITFKGTGELILSDPGATENGVLFGFANSVKLLDGLAMTGGTKEGDSGQLTFKAFPNEYYTMYKCMAGDKPATYIRIAPKAGAKPAEKPAAPSKPSSTGFSDVPDSHYAAAAIKDCVAKGVASGYSDGTFKPTAPVTRAQFCVMVARAFCPDALKREDTAANKAKGWYVPAASALYNSGIDGGVLSAASFCEDYLSADVMGQSISRYDMAQIMDNVCFCFGPGMDDAQRKAAQGKIADWSSIPEIYQSAVASCYAMGVIGGQSDGSFGGNNTMNRAQACVVIERMGAYVPIVGIAS